MCPCSLNNNSNSEHSLRVYCVLGTVPNFWYRSRLILTAADARGSVVIKCWTKGKGRWRGWWQGASGRARVQATLPSVSPGVLSGDVSRRDRPRKGGPGAFREQKAVVSVPSPDWLTLAGSICSRQAEVGHTWSRRSSTSLEEAAGPATLETVAQGSLMWKSYLKMVFQNLLRKDSQKPFWCGQELGLTCSRQRVTYIDFQENVGGGKTRIIWILWNGSWGRKAAI